MTAYMALAYPDRVEIISDGAHCLKSGKMIGNLCKVEASKHIPFAIIGRGQVGEVAAITDKIIEVTQYQTVDGVLSAIATSLAEGDLRKGKYDYEIAIAAISETLGPAAFVFTSRGPYSCPWGEIEPYTLAHWGGEPLVGGVPLEIEDLPADDLKQVMTGWQKGLDNIALPIMNAMRLKSKHDEWGEGEAYWIGGSIYHTVINQDGVHSRKIHDWPDRLFSKIGPEGVGLDG